MADLSIIIPAYNESLELVNLLDSIERHLEVETEVIVVDNGSTDDTAELARGRGCRLLQMPDRTYPAAVRNLGAQNASAPVLAFLDADVLVTKSWGRRVQQLLEDRSFLKGRFVTGDSCHVSLSPSWLERSWFGPLRRAAKDYINGANLLLARNLFVTAGGFNEELETGEDVDFCHRAAKTGATVRRDPLLVAHHEGFPKGLGGFFRRERWHGRGDYSSFACFRRSRVAQAAVAVGICYGISALVLALAVQQESTTMLLIGVAPLVMVLLLSAVSSIARIGSAGIRQKVLGTFLFIVYFSARFVAFLDMLLAMKPAEGVVDDLDCPEDQLGEASRGG